MGSTSRDRRPRAARRVLLAVLLITPLLLVDGTPADADHNTVFELDGNIAETTAGAPFDWASFFNASGSPSPALPDASRPGFLDSGFDADHAFPDLSTYTSGSKDILDVSGWSCTDSNNLGGKFDILNAYSTIYQDNGDLYLTFGIERAATEGDGNMGFWFLKDSSVDCSKTDKGKAPSFTGSHQDGDIFVVAAFSGGGTAASVTAYEWKGGSTGFLDVDNPIVAGGALCSSTTHDACGIVNTSPLTPPWPSPDKNGGPLDTNAFYEGFIRVDTAQVSGCFSTFVANTRSSTSPSATIHDFSRGSFTRCQPGTELTLEQYKINAGSAVASNSNSQPITVFQGDTLELVFAEKNDGNFTLDKPTAGRYVVIPNASQASACALSEVQLGGFNVGDVDPQNSKLDPDETWRYSCTISVGASTPTSFVAYGHGIDSVTAPGTVKDVTFCETPASLNPVLAPATVATCDSDERTTVSLTVLAPSTAMFASATLEVIFYEENDSNAPLSKPHDSDFVAQASSVCDTFAQVVQGAAADHPGKNVGDLDGNDVLDPNEKWQWKCTLTLGSATTTSATKSVTALGHGINGLFDVTFCSTAGTADQVVKVDATTNASPICDPHERRKVTLTIE